MLSKELGAQQRASGRVHPYFVLLGRALLESWRPEQVIGTPPERPTPQRNGGMAGLLGAWQKRADVYGRTGSPLTDVPGPRARVFSPTQDAVDLAISAHAALGHQVEVDEAIAARCILRVVQERSGRLHEVQLLEPSASATVDRGLLADLRLAGDALPPIPDDLLVDRDLLISRWEVALERGSVTEGLTFAFEERLALNSGLRKRVQLAQME